MVRGDYFGGPTGESSKYLAGQIAMRRELNRGIRLAGQNVVMPKPTKLSRVSSQRGLVFQFDEYIDYEKVQIIATDAEPIKASQPNNNIWQNFVKSSRVIIATALIGASIDGWAGAIILSLLGMGWLIIGNNRSKANKTS